MKINRLSGRATAAAVLAASFGVSLLNGQASPVPLNPRLAIRSGLVEVQRGSLWLPLTLGDSLRAGERVRTASGSSAVIEVGPDQLVTLNEISTVRVGQTAQANVPVVELESGSMKVFSVFDIRIAAKGTVLESAGEPLDLELGYQGGNLNLTVFNGAVQNGPITIRGGTQDPSARTYTAYGANGRPWSRRDDAIIANPVLYIYPYFMYGQPQPDPNAGRIVPPVVNNPTNPGFRPTQVVPPMSDPIRVPVTKP